MKPYLRWVQIKLQLINILLFCNKLSDKTMDKSLSWYKSIYATAGIPEWMSKPILAFKNENRMLYSELFSSKFSIKCNLSIHL